MHNPCLCKNVLIFVGLSIPVDRGAYIQKMLPHSSKRINKILLSFFEYQLINNIFNFLCNIPEEMRNDSIIFISTMIFKQISDFVMTVCKNCFFIYLHISELHEFYQKDSISFTMYISDISYC